MKFWFCDKCGQRVVFDELPLNATGEASEAVHCPKCAPAAVAVEVLQQSPSSSSRNRISLRVKAPDRTILESRNYRPRSFDYGSKRSKSGVLVVAGLTAGVALGVAGIFMVSSRSTLSADKSPAPLREAHPAVEIPRPAPAAMTASRVLYEPEASPAVKRTAVADIAAVPADEARAQEAFTELEKRLKEISETDKKVSAINEFVEQHAETIVASRARSLRDSMLNPVPAPAHKQHDAPASINRANELLKKSDFAGAIAEYDKLIAANEHVPALFQNRADAKRLAGDFEGVLADADKAIALSDKLFGAWALRAIACYGLKREEEYRASILKTASYSNLSASQAEQNLLPHLQRARMIVEGRAYEDQPPSTAQEFLARGQCRLALNKTAAGRADLNEALQRDATLANVVLPQLATIAHNEKKFDEALKYYKQWAAVIPETAPALNSYAWELLTCEDKSLIDPQAALPVAERATEISNNADAAILDTLALAYFKSKRLSEAISTEEKAISLLPRATPTEARKEYENRLAEFRGARP